MNVASRSMVRVLSMVVAVLAVAGPARAQDRLVQEERDAATNATVRVYKTTQGPRIDVQASSFRLGKESRGRKVITTLTGGGEKLVIEFDNKTLTVTGTAGRASASMSDQEGFERVSQVAAKSTLTRRASSLIARMGFGANSPIQPMLLSTRMFLLVLTNDHSGVREMSNWMQRTRARLQVVKASVSDDSGDRTPTQCWEEYVKEGVAAWLEYEQCMKDAPWWNIFAEAACTAIYDMRALGAFTWWLDCVKVTSFIK